MQMRHFDMWLKYNLDLRLENRRTCSQHKKIDEACARIGRYLFTHLYEAIRNSFVVFLLRLLRLSKNLCNKDQVEDNSKLKCCLFVI